MKSEKEIRQKLIELGYEQATIDAKDIEKRKRLVENINILLWVLD